MEVSNTPESTDSEAQPRETTPESTDSEAQAPNDVLFRGYDDKYHYECEYGHRSVTSNPDYQVCTAVLPWPGGEPCGADIEYRIIPMRSSG